MSIQFAILGLLSWEPMTGYDLKKRFADMESLYWSGNNNQIYRTLVALHKDNLVTQEIEHQDGRPSRKIYSITVKGRVALREWVQQTPELPQVRNPFLIQLAWTDQLKPDELNALLDRYAEELSVKLLMLREQQERDGSGPQRSPRESLLWQRIDANWRAFYENELTWVRQLRADLATL